jgi:hypothetical protein
MSSSFKHQVAMAVASTCGVTGGRLWHDRSHPYARARAYAFYAMRHAYGMTYGEVAALTGYGARTIGISVETVVGRLIDGDELTAQRLIRIADFLGVSHDAMFPRRKAVAA